MQRDEPCGTVATPSGAHSRALDRSVAAGLRSPLDRSVFSVGLCLCAPQYSILVGLVLMYVCYHQTSVFVAIALLGGIGYWLFNVRKQDIILSGRKFTDNELLVGFAALVGTVLFYVRTHAAQGGCSASSGED